MRYKCVKGCDWLIFAGWNDEIGALQVKTLHDVHQCSKAHNSRQVSARWVANKIMEKVRRNPHYKLQDIIDNIKEAHEVQITKNKASRSRIFARLMVEGNYQDQYRRVRDYGAEILRSNPGSTVKLELGNPGLHFRRLYVSVAACKKGFLAHCRPIICVDACHMRGPIPGQLLAAVSIDANDGMYPIAIAVAEAESKETWTWFLNNLYQDIGSAREHGWVFYSDQQKGLLAAVSDVFPGARQRFCLRHLYANFKKRFGGLVLKELMEAAAKETTRAGFERKMAEMKSIDRDAEAYLRGIPTEHWCKHTFPFYPKCDMLLNNLAETFNSKILGARDKPVITCVEILRRYLMTRIQKNRQCMLRYNGPICPRIQKKLEKSKSESMKCEPTWNGMYKYEVVKYGKTCVVDLENRICACNKWNITGIPCEHAVSAIAKNNERAEDYVDNYLRTVTYIKTYSYLLEPLNGEELWPVGGGLPILPPIVRKQPGRPSLRKRERDVDEPHNKNKLSKKVGKGKSVCSVCGNPGHNRRSCKEWVSATSAHTKVKGKSQCEVTTNENNGVPMTGDESVAQAKGKGKSQKIATANEGNGVPTTGVESVAQTKGKGKCKENQQSKMNEGSVLPSQIGGFSMKQLDLAKVKGNKKVPTGSKEAKKTVTCMGFKIPVDKGGRSAKKVHTPKESALATPGEGGQSSQSSITSNSPRSLESSVVISTTDASLPSDRKKSREFEYAAY